MIKEISILQYLKSEQKVQIIDVRSPKEFAHAHIPDAINMPLFNDEERETIGTTYKKVGREEAILKGLEIVGPKMANFVTEIKLFTKDNTRIVLHCWRGGMRSKSMAQLFDFCGIKTEVIQGGYKAYRREAQKMFLHKFPFLILGGRTGSAKTKILQALKKRGEQVIDLENLANHKGSAFGDLGEQPQPSSEMFENLLFEELRQLSSEKRVWLEDESHLIGTAFIPETFWVQMRNAPVLYCDFPTEERLQFLVRTYGDFDKDGVIASLKKITKKLGGQHTKAALEYYEAGNLYEATKIVLVYYDKSYDYGLLKREIKNIQTLKIDTINPELNALQLIQFLKSQENPISEINHENTIINN